MDSDGRPTDAIIADALSCGRGPEKWDMVAVLHYRGTREVMEAAHRLTESMGPDERCLGVDILAQLGIPTRSFPDEVCAILIDLLDRERDPDVLQSIATACGHNKGFGIVEPLARLRDHPSADVRQAVVFGLLGQEDECAIRTLMELCEDLDDDVRNWALFGLGDMIDTDNAEIRQVLLQAVHDSFDAVRGEALKGLARRRDERAIDPLIGELLAIAAAEEWWDYAFEAAENMPDVRLYPALVAARNSGIDDSTLDHAIALCRIPSPEEGEDGPTGAAGACPVCWRRRAFRKSEGWQFCKRCGWSDDADQRTNPDSKDGYNHSSLNGERARWRRRLDLARESSKD